MNNSQWQSDDGAPVPIRVKNAATDNAVAVATVSRRPAAVVGIAVVLALGLAFLHVTGALQAQVQTGTLVRITTDGFVPATITAAPGDVIRWKNEDTIPHIIASATLATEEANPMESTPIFPGDEYSATIGADVEPGSYPYISRTSNLNGEIVVKAAGAVSSASSSKSSLQRRSSNGPKDSSSSATPGAGAGQANVPVNPHTVDKAGVQSSSSSSAGAMGGPATSSSGKTKQTAPPITQTKTKPKTQPASGMADDGLVLLAIGGVWTLWRKHLRK